MHENQKVSPATCNEAEYQAVFLGIQRALHLGARKIKIFGDSKLVIRFDQVEVIQIPRAANVVADNLATAAISVVMQVSPSTMELGREPDWIVRSDQEMWVNVVQIKDPI